MKSLITDLLNSVTGKKMVASLSFLKESDKSKLSEYNWINELPLAQQELFDTIHKSLKITRVDLAFRLINGKLKNIACQHKNEVMKQGDGFVYVTCKDCGEDI